MRDGTGLRRRRRGASATATAVVSRPVAEDGADPAVARGLARALDRAMELGLLEHADRIARSTASLARDEPQLAERLARLRLAQGRPDVALDLVDVAPRRHASMRLLRIACLLRLGRKAEAHLDLLDWSRAATAPLDARLLLAVLEWEHGDRGAAIAAARETVSQLDNTPGLLLLLFVAAEAGRADAVDQTLARLATHFAGTPVPEPVALLLHGLDLGRLDRTATPTDAHREALALELLAAEPTISALVAAQRLEPDERAAHLLGDALEIALPDLLDQERGCAALAELALLHDRLDDAARWVERGLERNPMSAALVLLRDRLLERGIAVPAAGAPAAPPVLATIDGDASERGRAA